MAAGVLCNYAVRPGETACGEKDGREPLRANEPALSPAESFSCVRSLARTGNQDSRGNLYGQSQKGVEELRARRRCRIHRHAPRDRATNSKSSVGSRLFLADSRHGWILGFDLRSA